MTLPRAIYGTRHRSLIDRPFREEFPAGTPHHYQQTRKSLF